jgi:opacity protein-like surface antigen
LTVDHTLFLEETVKTLTFLSLVLALHLPVCIAAQAQDISLNKRSALELNVGLWSGRALNAIAPNGIRAEVGSDAFVGGLQFTHWVQEYLSVTFSAGLLAGKASSTVNILGVKQQVSSVYPVLLGLRCYALGSAAEGDVRPYLSLAAGPYVGAEVSNSIWQQETRTETAFGGRLGAGVDFIVSDHFKLGAHVGYNVMSDFSIPVGGRRNYNGGEFSLGLGYLF